MTQAATPLSAAQSSRTTLSGKTVLIADDDISILRILEARCRALGLRVETSTDGLRTLLKVAKEKPDLLILDLNLPDVDGFKVVERLTDPKFPPLPVIVLTPGRMKLLFNAATNWAFSTYKRARTAGMS